MINGYKAFNLDKTNRHGFKMEEKKTYEVTGEIKFGTTGNGFHMCNNLVDVFKYYDPETSLVAEVIGFGNYEKIDLPNIDYYDQYVVEKIRIEKFLSRHEIINNILNDNESNVLKFLSYSKLNDEEIVLFIRKFYNKYSIMRALMYYQLDYKDIYYDKYEESIKKVKKIYK